MNKIMGWMSLLMIAACSGTSTGSGTSGGGGTLGSSGGSGGSFSCDMSSKCSAQPPPSSSEIASCKTELSGSCGAEYQAFVECLIAGQTCTSDGRASSGGTLASCQTQYSAYSTCKKG
jgi:hypothetical protein